MMTRGSRIESYMAQNGSRRDFTPAQKRRYKRKANLADKRMREVETHSFTFIVPVNECPTCKVQGDSPCVTASGNLAKKPHAGRNAA